MMRRFGPSRPVHPHDGISSELHEIPERYTRAHDAIRADHVVNAMIRTTVYISKTSSPMWDVTPNSRFRQGFFEMVFAASIRHIADSDAVERLAWNPDCACHESSSA